MSEDKSTDGFWDREDFEDKVARALIACYETRLFHKPPPAEKGHTWVLVPHRAGTVKDLQDLRDVGPYFPPSDRYCLGDNTYWGDIDGFPPLASYSLKRAVGDSLDGLEGKSYLEPYICRRVQNWPRGVAILPGRYVAKYRVVGFFPQPDGIEAYAYYIGVKRNGKVVAEKHVEWEDWTGSIVLQFWADRRFLWNVQAFESEAKATFGVNEAQIKSLFYARQIPLTTTGRKRPILHWVRSHLRRMRSGVEVDIERHLRGITEFEMNGTLFRITRPVKRTHAHD